MNYLNIAMIDHLGGIPHSTLIGAYLSITELAKSKREIILTAAAPQENEYAQFEVKSPMVYPDTFSGFVSNIRLSLRVSRVNVRSSEDPQKRDRALFRFELEITCGKHWAMLRESWSVATDENGGFAVTTPRVRINPDPVIEPDPNACIPDLSLSSEDCKLRTYLIMILTGAYMDALSAEMQRRSILVE